MSLGIGLSIAVGMQSSASSGVVHNLIQVDGSNFITVDGSNFITVS